MSMDLEIYTQQHLPVPCIHQPQKEKEKGESKTLIRPLIICYSSSKLHTSMNYSKSRERKFKIQALIGRSTDLHLLLILRRFGRQRQLRRRPRHLRRGGGGRRRLRGVPDQQKGSLAPWAADGVGDLVIPGAVSAVGSGVVEGTSAVAVVGAALNAPIGCGNAAFEKVPQKGVASCSSGHGLEFRIGIDGDFVGFEQFMYGFCC